MTDATGRFSDRVDDYVRARPGYPVAILDAALAETGLEAPLEVADVGSGTGIFTRLLLERGHTVHAVEPNEPMRGAAEEALSTWPGFHSVDGRAEATGLPDASVDLVTAAQAFHWFDVAGARAEWRRILRPPRWALLLWNDRRAEGDPFSEAYEAFLREWGGEAYGRVHRAWDIPGSLGDLFGADGWSVHEVPNAQELDTGGLQARLASSSYLPGPGQPQHGAMLLAAARLFERHAEGGRVRLVYTVRAYVGRL